MLLRCLGLLLLRPQLVSFACLAVGLQERDPVAAALAFLTHVLGAVDKLTGASASEQRAR